MKKTSNILFRVSEEEKNIIELKSVLFGKKKSQFILDSTMSNWDDSTSNKHFKELLEKYKSSSQEEKDVIIQLLFEYYRKTGFPHTHLTDEQKTNRMNRIINTKSVLLPNDELQQNSVGVELPNAFHPGMESVEYSSGNLKSPLATYKDDDSFLDSIKRWLDLDKSPHPAGIRRILRTRNGTRGVTNFKPAISKYIYETYCPVNGQALDPCAGFSGRLTGAIASKKNIYYTGIDPEPKTASGNMECASFFKPHYDFGFSFHLGCAEEEMTKMQSEFYNLVFTSPPYFNVENYSNSITQSHNKFDSYQSWKSNFLNTIILESKRVLKSNGYLIINTKNYNKFYIADDVVAFAKKIGFKLNKTYKMRLANNEFNRSKSTFHHEPIFVFKK